MIRLRPSGVDEILIKRVQDWYEPGPGVFIQSLTASFSPAMLFTGSTTGAWYDPSDITTLYQDAAGTTPVTAVEQPVGLMKDKSGRNNHAFNSSGNSANFPVLSARYNLLTKTEDFSDAVWGKFNCTAVRDTSVLSPIGTQTASLITVSTTAFTYLNLASTISTSSTASHSLLMAFRANTVASLEVALFDNTAWGTGSAVIVSGPGSLSQVIGSRFSLTGLSTSQWTVVRVTRDAGATQLAPYVYPRGQGTSQAGDSLYIWGADLRATNDALNQPAYQRVNTATDYDTVGFKPYLRFNGTNQWLQTNSIDFTYGDKMFVSAGVRKLSDAAPQGIVELSLNADANNGSFWVRRDYQYLVRSGGGTNAVFTDSVSAPRSDVIALIADLAAPLTRTRLNGVDGNTSANPSGGGNFGNYPLYIGARAGTSLWFNGRLYQMVIAGKQASASEITSTETYINQKTGAF